MYSSNKVPINLYSLITSIHAITILFMILQTISMKLSMIMMPKLYALIL